MRRHPMPPAEPATTTGRSPSLRGWVSRLLSDTVRRARYRPERAYMRGGKGSAPSRHASAAAAIPGGRAEPLGAG